MTIGPIDQVYKVAMEKNVYYYCCGQIHMAFGAVATLRNQLVAINFAAVAVDGGPGIVYHLCHN